MVKKKESKKSKESEEPKEEIEVEPEKESPKMKKTSNEPKTMLLETERAIAMDFAAKVYTEFDKIIKSIVLFGSSAKKVSTKDSDIDIIIIIDDVAVKWDQELIAWYRSELGDIMKQNPYTKSLHINTVKLSTWWQDLSRGDPIIINILRYGDPLIDFGGFFTPLKVLLQEGKIKPTPEAIYTLLQRTPQHIARTRASLVNAIDGLYWAIVDSAHAALISANVMPASPEQIPKVLTKTFVNKKLLDKKYAKDYAEIYALTKEILHGKRAEISGKEIDDWIDKANDFVRTMAELIDKLVESS